MTITRKRIILFIVILFIITALITVICSNQKYSGSPEDTADTPPASSSEQSGPVSSDVKVQDIQSLPEPEASELQEETPSSELDILIGDEPEPTSSTSSEEAPELPNPESPADETPSDTEEGSE